METKGWMQGQLGRWGGQDVGTDWLLEWKVDPGPLSCLPGEGQCSAKPGGSSLGTHYTHV